MPISRRASKVAIGATTTTIIIIIRMPQTGRIRIRSAHVLLAVIISVVGQEAGAVVFLPSPNPCSLSPSLSRNRRRRLSLSLHRSIDRAATDSSLSVNFGDSQPRLATQTGCSWPDSKFGVQPQCSWCRMEELCLGMMQQSGSLQL